MKKLLLASAILFSGIAFTSCSDDDDVIVTEQNELVGTWKAEFLTYQFGGHGGTYPYDHEIFKQGCATDYLTINSDQTAVLVENNRDRKSTRLNSSHVAISYAVFCLKKKKRTI